jgi:peroxiredoxin-like protein
MSVGCVESNTLSTSVSVPAEMNGPGVGTNPEHLLLSAATTCYIITLAAILSNRKIPYIRLHVETEGVVIDDRGLRFDSIEHRPTIVVPEGTDTSRLATLAEHAEHACMVSGAMRGNVRLTVVPSVVIENGSSATSP